LPRVYDILLVIGFAFVGSVLRELNGRQPKNFVDVLKRLISPVSVIIDPIISLIVFGCIFLLTLLTKRSLLEVGGDASLIYIVAPIALGAVSGFLGIRALYAVIKRMGIDISEQDLVHPPVAHAAPRHTRANSDP
jgi:hypothetical protein